MKKTLLFVSILLVSLYCMGQEVNNHMLVSSGNTIIHEGIILDWVVGGSPIDYDILFDLSTHTESLSTTTNIDFKAYPTITSGQVNIYTKLKDQKDFSIEIYDYSLKRLKTLDWKSNPQEVNFETFSAGLYFIKISKKNSKTQAVFKIILK